MTLEAVKRAGTTAKLNKHSEAEAARGLVKLAREQGPSLTVPDGLLKQLTQTVIETVLDEELTEHLGYEKHGAAEFPAASIQRCLRFQLPRMPPPTPPIVIDSTATGTACEGWLTGYCAGVGSLGNPRAMVRNRIPGWSSSRFIRAGMPDDVRDGGTSGRGLSATSWELRRCALGKAQAGPGRSPFWVPGPIC